MSDADSDLQCIMQCAAGSYEGSLFGWNLLCKKDDGALALDMKYGFHCSFGSVRSITVSPGGKYLVCGGNDEKIHIYDMKTQKSIGELTKHTGAVTSLKFVGDSFLLSGSEDNTVCIWRVYDWQCLHVLGGHKAAVHDIAVHPSGKAAMSVGGDNTMRLWNLVTGKAAFTRSLKQTPRKVHWDSGSEGVEGGSHYIIVHDHEVHCFLAADNAPTAVVQRSKYVKVCQAGFYTPTATATGAVPQLRMLVLYEDRSLCVYNADGGALLAKVVLTAQLVDSSLGLTAGSIAGAAGGRPKDFVVCKGWFKDGQQGRAEGEGDDCTENLVTLVTTNGRLLAFSTEVLESRYAVGADGSAATPQQTAEEEAEVFDELLQCGTVVSAEPRLTCLVAWNRKPVKQMFPTMPSSSSSAASQAASDAAKDKAHKQNELKNAKKSAKKRALEEASMAAESESEEEGEDDEGDNNDVASAGGEEKSARQLKREKQKRDKALRQEKKKAKAAAAESLAKSGGGVKDDFLIVRSDGSELPAAKAGALLAAKKKKAKVVKGGEQGAADGASAKRGKGAKSAKEKFKKAGADAAGAGGGAAGTKSSPKKKVRFNS